MFFVIISKVQRADLTWDVIKKLAPFVLSKLLILVADWSMGWSQDTFLIRLRLYLPRVIMQVQSGNGVLNRLVSCIKCMELAC